MCGAQFSCFEGTKVHILTRRRDDGAAVNSLESAAVHASKKRTADVHQKAEKDEQGGKSAAHRSQKSSKTRAGAGLPSSAAAAGPHTAVYLASAYCYTQILLYTAVYKAA